MFSLEEGMYSAAEEHQKEKIAEYCKVRLTFPYFLEVDYLLLVLVSLDDGP